MLYVVSQYWFSVEKIHQLHLSKFLIFLEVTETRN